MIRSVLVRFFLLILSVLWVGCALQPVQSPFQAKDLNPKLRTTAQKVDTFIVIMDNSGSMKDAYGGKQKAVLAKEFIIGMNQTIPDLSLMAGLRTFGNTYCPVTLKTELVYGMTQYSKPALEQSVQQVGYPSGRSPLAKAINGASNDLSSEKGNLAVIIVSDGDDMDDSPLMAAQEIKKTYGGRICIYSVLIGDDPGGKALLEKIAAASGCGAFVSADAIASAAGMADFVEMVFLGTVKDSDGDGVMDSNDQCPNTPRGVPVDSMGCPLDSDGDRVYDHKDRCPGTPRGVKVDRRGCPLDSDGDGVNDHLDKCPGTPKGAEVNEVGCWVLGGTRLDAGNVLFDTNKSDIKSAAYPVLDEVVAILKRDPSLRVEIQGHTDNVGSAVYNKALSERRAKSVLNHLVSRGIAGDRLSAVGYGLENPVATNATKEGRAQNRRVELKPLP